MPARDPYSRRSWRDMIHRSRELGDSVRIRRAEKERDVEYLVDALTDPDSRRAAAVALGTLEAPEAARPVERLLQARDWRVRGDAAVALGRIRDSDSVPALIELARDDEAAFVRFDAVGALHEFDEPAATEGLAAALADESATIRRWAAMELAERGDPRGTAELRAQHSRLRPRMFDLGRWAREPQVTLPFRIVVPLALAWLSVTSLVVEVLTGPAVVVVGVATIVGFNELWLRLREREARKRGIFRMPRDAAVAGNANVLDVVVPLVIALVLLFFGGDSVYGLVPLTLFFLIRRLFVERSERMSKRFAGFLASRPRLPAR